MDKLFYASCVVAFVGVIGMFTCAMIVSVKKDKIKKISFEITESLLSEDPIKAKDLMDYRDSLQLELDRIRR